MVILISLKEENNKLYLEKELFFNKREILKKIVREYDNKNVFFFKYILQIYPFRFKIMKAYFQKLKNNDDQDFHGFLFKTIFTTSIKTYPYFIEKSKTFVSKKWPLLLADNFSGILGNVGFYLSPELYANKSFFKNFNETTTVDVTSAMLQSFRTSLKNQNYSISKIYGFKVQLLLHNLFLKKIILYFLILKCKLN